MGNKETAAFSTELWNILCRPVSDTNNENQQDRWRKVEPCPIKREHVYVLCLLLLGFDFIGFGFLAFIAEMLVVWAREFSIWNVRFQSQKSQHLA